MLDLARQLFSEQGFAATSLGAAERAGISKPQSYNCFGFGQACSRPA
ncbi:hypothetical protein GCM10009854_49960 [Saccharopolyspora halophila]|uniref:HTH tetR-type domain-containing protein n=1 Tax=Saccharopolyspora halophila TaxID=405551 RepID=A0ABN3GXZ4_9PSEU